MERSGCRALSKYALLPIGMLAVCTACTTTQAPLEQAPAAAASTASASSHPSAESAREAGIELPEGPGREILARACLGCHDLSALALFKSFYTRERWHELVITMQANGAAVDDAEVDVLADYLAQHFGTGETIGD